MGYSICFVVVDHSGLKLRWLESLFLGTYIITSMWLETLSLSTYIRAGVVMQVITKSVLGKIIHISK